MSDQREPYGDGDEDRGGERAGTGEGNGGAREAGRAQGRTDRGAGEGSSPHGEPGADRPSRTVHAAEGSHGRPRTEDAPLTDDAPLTEGEYGTSRTGGAHGAHGRAPTVGHGWRRFRRSPYFPACVLVLIIAAAAGLFAGSYTYAMANPTPRHLPAAVVSPGGASAEHTGKARAFVAGMEKALGSSLELHRYRTFGEAKQAVEAQKVFTVLRIESPGRLEMDLASASGASVAQLLQQSGPKVAKAVGVQLKVRDLKPLAKGDPRGLVIFYISLAATIIGFIGAIQLSANARELNPPERIGFILVYAVVGGFVIAAMVDWLLGAIDLPFLHSWGILSLTMFTSGMVFTMFNTFLGRWAMIPTWGLMVLLGNPSSGGAVSWPLLPSVLGAIGRWLPPGASVNAQHTAVYFPGYQHLQPYLVLAAWVLVSTTVFWTWRHRHPGGRPKGPAHAGS